MNNVLNTASEYSMVNTTIGNSDATTDSETVQGPLFFNYHEFAENFYIDLNSANQSVEHDEDHSIYMTHFPNIYVPEDSEEFKTTRIVRIPRRFDTTIETPYFSSCLPGREPAAFNNTEEGQHFVVQGIYDGGHLFGCSSVSPLSKYIDQWDFERIVMPINKILSDAFATFTWHNLVDLVLEILTLGCWHFLSRYFIVDPLVKLENYVAEANELPQLKNNKIKIISPRRSGYLSVSTEVPSN